MWPKSRLFPREIEGAVTLCYKVLRVKCNIRTGESASVVSASIRYGKTAINDAIRNGAQMHEVREFAGHRDIRTMELYFIRKGEDAEMAARRIQIRVGRRLDG
jgi:hypothetical protein